MNFTKFVLCWWKYHFGRYAFKGSCQVGPRYFQLAINLVSIIFNLQSFWVQIWVCFNCQVYMCVYKSWRLINLTCFWLSKKCKKMQEKVWVDDNDQIDYKLKIIGTKLTTTKMVFSPTLFKSFKLKTRNEFRICWIPYILNIKKIAESPALEFPRTIHPNTQTSKLL